MTRFDITLTALHQKVLALVLVLVPLSLVLTVFFSFVSAQIVHHRQVTLLVHELNRYQALLKDAPQRRMRLATLKSSPLWRNLFLTETSASPKNTPPQNFLTGIVAKAGGTVLHDSVQANETQQSGAMEINERVVFEADIAMLTHVLYELRAPEPLLVIRHLSVHDHEGPLTGPRTAPNRLYIELEATGFARPS